MNKKRALIFGILGQDGCVLTNLLLNQGNYDIYGIVREEQSGAQSLAINLIPVNLLNAKQIQAVISIIQPDEIYNFAGISDVFSPWNNLDLIFDINALLPQNICEGMRNYCPKSKLIQASSCLIFGRDKSGFQDENTPTNPIYPYGVAKLYADNMIKEFRYQYDIFACSAILFPHTSQFQKESFFPQKMAKAAASAKNGKLNNKIKVGDLSQYRNIGFAGDIVRAMHLMAQNKEPLDYVVGGKDLIITKEFAEKCFDFVGLKVTDYIEIDSSLIRKDDTKLLRANTAKIENELKWRADFTIDKIVSILMEHQLRLQQ